MNAKLLNSPRPKGITGSNQDREVILKQPKANFAQIGTFSDTINADKRNRIGIRGAMNFPQEINT
jgi:hypothetical protein